MTWRTSLGPLTLMLAVFSAGATAGQTDDLRATLKARFPEIEVKSIGPASIPDWFEVVTPNELVYVNKDASLLFAGNVLDTKTRVNLTAKRWGTINAINFKSLPFDLAIKSVKGNGSRELVIFSDPECPYCQQLEKELTTVTDVTIHTFLFPLESIHPGATDKSRNIWCSSDRASTWSAWMLTRVVPPSSASCAGDPVSTLAELGTRLKVVSTPTLIFADGHRVDGAIPRAQLESEFASASP